MSASKEIKNRIKSAKNMGKITKAMELISTIKMKKAKESVLVLRPFALAALALLENLSDEHDILSEYTNTPQNTDRELIVIIASQKGLCGGYNENIFRKFLEYRHTNKASASTKTYDYIAVGKRAREFILRIGGNLVGDFSDTISDPPSTNEARSLVRFLLDGWKQKKYQSITLVYSHYMSAIRQEPLLKPLFPLDQETILDFLRKVIKESEQEASLKAPEQHTPFLIEGGRALIFEYVFPLILDTIVYETILEARAAEHAARMISMQNAKEASQKKMNELTLVYNKARQGAITTEITEIVSGVESMKE